METNKHQFRIAGEFSGSTTAALLLIACTLLASCGSGTEKKDLPEIVFEGKPVFGITAPEKTLLIGDPYTLTLWGVYPTNDVVDFPEVGREKDIVLLDRDWQEEPYTNGYKKTEVSLTVTSFRIGDHVIVTDPVIHRHDGIAETNRLPETRLSVVSSLPEDAPSEIADIKPVHKLPGRVPPWLWISLGTALTAFLVGLVSSKLWKHREAIVPAAPPVPPHIVALQALEALKRKGLLEKDECKSFYTELSSILRTYLEGRFHLNAPEETTEEIIEEMSRSTELNGLQRTILQDFMRQADMVKFAKGHPDRATMEAAFGTTKQFVEETKHTNESNG